jgi:hypothetical protein
MEHLRIVSGDIRHPVQGTLEAAVVLVRRTFAITVVAASITACGGLFDNGTPPSAEALAAATASDAVETAAPSRTSIPNVSRPTNSGNGSASGTTATTLATATPTSTAPSGGSGTTEPATAANLVDTIVADMKLFHDGPSAVLESLPGWGSGASWPEATPRPSGWQFAIPWTHVMADTSSPNGNGYPWRVPGPYTGNQGYNTRVQQRDVQMWWLLSDGRWVLGSHNNALEPVMYPLHWAEGTEAYATDVLRNESGNGGGVSMRSIGREGYARHLWHAWAAPHRVPDNALGAVTVFFARKILDNPAGPDDRAQVRLMAAGAGDWYRDQATLTTPKVQGQNVLYMGFSRLKYITNDWQVFGWTSLSEAQLRANPPPVIGL